MVNIIKTGLKTAAEQLLCLYTATVRPRSYQVYDSWPVQLSAQVVPEHSISGTLSDVFLYILQKDSVDFDGQTLQQP